MFKRGLRQLRLKLKSSRTTQQETIQLINKAEIRKKVQSLHEFEEDSFEEWGVNSKFHLEAFKLDFEPKGRGKECAVPDDLSIESILKFINESSASENVKLYKSDESNPNQVPQIVLSLPSTPARKSLLQSILKTFKPMFPKRSIPVDGEGEKTADWIVIDLKSAIVHIFDPKTRLEIDLDGKLQAETALKSEDSLPKFIEALSKSLPRSIASRPNFIDKFNKSK